MCVYNNGYNLKCDRFSIKLIHEQYVRILRFSDQPFVLNIVSIVVCIFVSREKEVIPFSAYRTDHNNYEIYNTSNQIKFSFFYPRLSDYSDFRKNNNASDAKNLNEKKVTSRSTI